jgi:regulator of protease activity HflC (stomatin/prohibitin superfamily)
MSHTLINFTIIFLILWIGLVLWRRHVRWLTVFEWERALLYDNGKYVRTLEAGRYMFLAPWQKFTSVDLRAQVLQVVNQEVVCADNMALRIACSVTYKIVDPVTALHSTTRYQDMLYLDMQMVMRDLVCMKKIDEALATRSEISQAFTKTMAESARKLGLEIESAGIRDITFPPDVKKVFAQVTAAEKEAQATLAKARAETASLRALANASRMMEDHPALITLRTLQSVSELASSSGNTVVFGLPQVLMQPAPGAAAPARPQFPTEE